MGPRPRISRSGCIQYVIYKTKILCFSTFKSSCKIDFQNHSGESVRNHGDSMVANPKLVPVNGAVTCGLPYHSPAEENHIETTAPREQVTYTVDQTPASSHTLFRKAMGNRDVSEEVMDIICLSWRDKTTSPYEGVLRRWKNYCSQKDVDPLVTDVNNVLDFLHRTYKLGCRYNCICTATSALFSAVTISGYERMSNHPLMSLSVKDICNKHPAPPKYVNLCDDIL